MNIIEERYNRAYGATIRPKTTHLILHHAAGMLAFVMVEYNGMCQHNHIDEQQK